MHLLHVLLLALSGQPECATLLTECVKDEASSFYPSLATVLAPGQSPTTAAALLQRLKDGSEACKPRNWAVREQCIAQCPLHLKVLEPAEYQMNACLIDNQFQPWDSAAHFDANHPLVGKEMELIQVGSKEAPARRLGCDTSFADDLADNKTFNGKVTLVRRGDCYFYDKVAKAYSANASVVIVANTDGGRSLEYEQNLMLTGQQLTQFFPGVPALALPRHYGEILYDALDKGVKLVTRIEVSCNQNQSVGEQDRYLIKGTEEEDPCPHPNLQKYCSWEADPARRLCSYCVVWWAWGEGDEKVCLQGNDLMPKKKELFYWTSLAGLREAGAKQEHEMVFLKDPPKGGCTEEDFEGLSGKHVLLPTPPCIILTSIRRAAAAGVAGYTVMTPASSRAYDLASGPSSVVNIPVHSVSPENFTRLATVFMEEGVPVPGLGHPAFALPGRLIRGAPQPVAPPPPSPVPSEGDTLNPLHEASTEEEEVWKWDVAVLLPMSLGALLLCLIAHRLHALRRKTLPDTEDLNDRVWTVPLGVASTGLSLSLLIVIGVVAFTLAHLAGQEAVDTAVENGRSAVAEIHSNARENVNHLSQQLITAATTSAISTVDGLLDVGEAEARSVSAFYRVYDGTWASFDANTIPFVEMTRASSDWKASVLTTKGYFISQIFKTDDRPVDSRDDWMANLPHVDSAPQAFDIPVSRHLYVHEKLKFLGAMRKEDLNPHFMVAGYPTEKPAYKAAEGLIRGQVSWLFSPVAVPTSVDFAHPIAVISPIFDLKNIFSGYVEVRLGLDSLRSAWRSVSSPTYSNLTFFVFEKQAGSLLSVNTEETSLERERLLKVSREPIHRVLTFNNARTPQVRSFGHYLYKKLGISSLKAGATSFVEFEQKEQFVPTPITVMRISSGVVTNGWPVETACKEAGEGGYLFDGVCNLEIGQYLTKDAPVVLETAVESTSGYKNSFPPFAKIVQGSVGGRQVECIGDFNPKSNESKCVLRESFTMYLPSFTFSVRIKPDHPSSAFEKTKSSRSRLETPVLMEDTQEGEGNVKLYANGELRIGVIRVACQTDPLTFEAKVWSTLTVVVTGETCSVFLNGRLASRVERYPDVSMNDREEAYTVGRGYEGLMDDIRFFNDTLTEEEVLRLHEGERGADFVREVPERWWQAGVTQLTRTGWLFTAMLPRDDIMREVDRNNLETVRALEVQEENTRRSLDRQSIRSVLVIIVVILTSVVVFLIFNDALTAPFASVATMMLDAAWMRIDTVPPSKSFITELSVINAAGGLMVSNLKQYRSYMPQTLLRENSSSEDSCSSGAQSQRADTSRTSHSGSYSGSIPTTRSTSAANDVRRAGFVVSLVKKRVTFLHVNVRDWHHHMSNLGEDVLIHMHSEVLHQALNAFHFSKGVAEIFSGDRFTASFNSARTLGTHRTAACSAALQVRQGLKKLKLEISASIVSGECRVGNLGNDIMKRYSFLSPVFTWCHALERYARHVCASIVADHSVFEDVTGHYLIRYLDAIIFPKRSSKDLHVAEVVCPRGSCVEEWMYMIETHERVDPFKDWNMWVRAVIAGDFELAAKALDNGDPIPVSRDDAVYKRLAACCERREPYDAVAIPFH